MVATAGCADTDPPVAPGSTTLRDEVRPTMGGLEIKRGVERCTLGFNTVLDGEPVTYTADATGGYLPYSYQWFMNEDSVEFEGDEEELEVEVDDESFMLQVRIEDSKGFIEWSDEVVVDVSPNHPNCQLSP